jgi:hypothetical protein
MIVNCANCKAPISINAWLLVPLFPPWAITIHCPNCRKLSATPFYFVPLMWMTSVGAALLLLVQTSETWLIWPPLGFTLSILPVLVFPSLLTVAWFRFSKRPLRPMAYWV